MMNNEELLALWREAGGDTHGPIVETATIPLDYLPQFVEAVRGQRVLDLESLARLAERFEINAEVTHDEGTGSPLRHDVDISEDVAAWIRRQSPAPVAVPEPEAWKCYEAASGRPAIAETRSEMERYRAMGRRIVPLVAPAQEGPVKQLEVDWGLCQELADMPTVDMALRDFVENSTGDNAVCLVRAVLAASPLYDAAPAAVPGDLDNTVRAANRATHPIAKETLISEAVEILDRLGAAPSPAESESQCCCGETDDAWRLCPEHGPESEETDNG